MKKKLLLLVAAMCSVVLTGGGLAYAAPDTDFNQVINDGTLATDILDASQQPVANPSITLTSKAFSFACYDGTNPSTGTFGDNTQRIYVINPGAADSGWNLTLAATDGPTALWENGGATETYDFNDATGAGCTDGADTDTDGGQMSLDPTAGTITLDCASLCTATGITEGSADAYEEGTGDSITLIAAAAGSDNNWRGYQTGIAVEQTIPAQQVADSYVINMTLTAVAL